MQIRKDCKELTANSVVLGLAGASAAEELTPVKRWPKLQPS